jgi:hypothetical protein
MKALQPGNNQDHTDSLCVPCVYYSKNLDASLFPPSEPGQHVCGLGFAPGDDKCAEMRTNNCGMRKKKD